MKICDRLGAAFPITLQLISALLVGTFDVLQIGPRGQIPDMLSFAALIGISFSTLEADIAAQVRPRCQLNRYRLWLWSGLDKLSTSRARNSVQRDRLFFERIKEYELDVVLRVVIGQLLCMLIGLVLVISNLRLDVVDLLVDVNKL